MAFNPQYRKMVTLKTADQMANLLPGNTAAGGFVVSDKSDIIAAHDTAYYIGGVSACYKYDADNDAWQQIPNSGLTGTFAAGSCGEFRAMSAPGGVFTQTATGGTTSTINTALTIVHSPVDYEIRVVAGTGIGYSGKVSAARLGATSILTVTPASAVAFDATTQYQIFGGSLWFFNAGTAAVGFGVYDRITNAWTARSVAGIPTAWGTDAQIVSTPGRSSNNGSGFVNGTATSGGASTLTHTGMTWPVDGWRNFQVRIKSGTGAGQIRKIASNTATVLTTSVAWTVAPDATSLYVIEGDDDAFYLIGNAAVAMYKFTVSSNTWATVSPVAARAGAPGAGMSADWVDGVQEATWSDGTYGNHYSTTTFRQNGRYLFCFRGGGGALLDLFDIAGVTWISGVVYGQAMETFAAGSCSVDMDGIIYIQKEATGRIFQFNVAKNRIDPFVLNISPQGAAVAGDKMFMTSFKEDGKTLKYLYTLHHTRTEMVRWPVI